MNKTNKVLIGVGIVAAGVGGYFGYRNYLESDIVENYKLALKSDGRDVATDSTAKMNLEKMQNAGILKAKGFLGFGGGNYVLRDMQQLPENSHLQLSDSQIISIAIAQGGKITATALALKMEIPVDIAKKKLDELQKNDIFEMNVTENGTIVYHLMDTSLLNP